MSKKDSVPSYQSEEPDPAEPSRNDILNRYGMGSEETDEEREMREWEEAQAARLAEQEAARRGSAGSTLAVQAQAQDRGPVLPDGAVVLEMPQFTLADSDASREEQLLHYARTITASERAAEAAAELVERHRILATGGSLEQIRENELWRERGYTSFDGCVQDLWGFSGDYANKMIRGLPVVRALGELASSTQLKERQLRALVGVWQTHGEKAVREVWEEAVRLGRTSGAGLEEAAKALGYGPAVEIPATVVNSKGSIPAPSAPQFDHRAEAMRLLNFDGFLRIAAQHHTEARGVLEEMRRLLDEAEKELADRTVDA